MVLHQIKNLLHNKGNNYQRQYIEWKIFATYSSDRRLVSRICKEVKKLNPKRVNNPTNK
jgi:hypothetical protein